ncbi:MAG: hypothetical protein KY476_00460 [Planctomycetes bacterium]|nr:hypothetical protein [Planctomycetota bacterium]
MRGQLPFHEISDEGFGDRLFYRAKAAIDAFTERARESGEFLDQLLGAETRAGFRLVDLLSQRYDVVAANPPYMGSKNMGPALKKYVERNFKPAKRDMYAAFILRNLELAAGGGRVAMVTQQSWMFLRAFAQLRIVNHHASQPTRCDSFRGLVVDTSLETLVHLGRYAFSEIGNAAVAPLLFTLGMQPPSTLHRLWACRLASPRVCDEQSSLLRQAISGNFEAAVSHPAQSDFVGIPSAPLVYYLREDFFALLKQDKRLGNFASIRQGLATADKERFIRTVWEAGHTDRWRPAAHGGGYSRWWGPNTFTVEWEYNGARVKAFPPSVVRNEQFYGRSGYWYAQVASGSLGLRYLYPGSIFTNISSGVFPLFNSSLVTSATAAFLNSRVATYLLRSLSQKIVFSEGYPPLLPWPSHLGCQPLVTTARECKACEISCREMTDITFECATPFRQELTLRLACISALRHTVAACLERAVVSSFQLNEAAIMEVTYETGTPSGWYPLLTSYDQPPSLGDSIRLPEDALARLIDHSRCTLERAELDLLRSHLRTHFGAGPLGRSQPEPDQSVNEDEDEGEALAVGARIAIPPDSFLEELSQRLEIHPISVYWLLKEGIETEGWRCLPEERRLWADRITVTVLRLLGHCWPKQIEAGEPVPDWADPDGIIPLTPFANESTLDERVQERLRAEEIDAGDFAEVMGKLLDAWLAIEFFKQHASQFKKRPIAWQIQSGTFTARRAAAFACLAYYHRLDGDLLPKIRTQYVGVLRQRHETELRGVLAVPAEVRSDRQEGRRLELLETLEELKALDTKLADVIDCGFGPEKLQGTLRQYAIDDACLALKAHWLRRLSETVRRNVLDEWLWAAARADLHPDLGSWIAEACERLDHHCAAVGPKPPKAAALPEEPTAADLAPIICREAKAMVEGALEGSCDVWWKRFDATVLAPIKADIKARKADLADCEAEISTDPPPPRQELNELKLRSKELKAEICDLNRQVRDRTARAKGVRNEIESWSCAEAAGWEPWLAEQPLYDEVASLDGRRPPPQTVSEFVRQESAYVPDINDGVRVNIAPLQKAGVLAADVLNRRDVDKAIADRAEWRADERRWVREGKLPRPGWWPEIEQRAPRFALPQEQRRPFGEPALYPAAVLIAMLRNSDGSSDLMRLVRAYSLLVSRQQLVDRAPRDLKNLAVAWAASFCESPAAGYFRETILDLLNRERLDHARLRDGVAVLINADRIRPSDPWLIADAQLALAVVDSLPEVAAEELGTQEDRQAVRLLIAG